MHQLFIIWEQDRSFLWELDNAYCLALLTEDCASAEEHEVVCCGA